MPATARSNWARQNVVLDRVIVDVRATADGVRLANDQNTINADGDG